MTVLDSIFWALSLLAMVCLLFALLGVCEKFLNFFLGD